MRIIAGSAKGRTLAQPAGVTRPTSDRTREGIFSALESEIGTCEGMTFLDLFGGTGAVGLEALSRGASEVIVVEKDVNSGFVGTDLEIELRRKGIQRLVIVGFFTNMCVETTTRMAGNLGFDTYLVPDCCSTSNRIGWDGADYDPELVHDMTVANLHGEFCTAITPGDALGLLAADNTHLERVQGNE